MKLQFIDMEIEKEFIEDFWSYDYRYCLDEIIKENGLKYQAKIIIRSNDFCDIIQEIGKLILNNDVDKIDFVENHSLLKYRNLH